MTKKVAKTEVSFEVSVRDKELIRKLVKRADEIGLKHGVEIDKLQLEMDLCAAHANGCELRLQDLLDTDDANFSHDVFGISRFLNRATGQIPAEKFAPRYAAKQ